MLDALRLHFPKLFWDPQDHKMFNHIEPRSVSLPVLPHLQHRSDHEGYEPPIQQPPLSIFHSGKPARCTARPPSLKDLRALGQLNSVNLSLIANPNFTRDLQSSRLDPGSGLVRCAVEWNSVASQLKTSSRG